MELRTKAAYYDAWLAGTLGNWWPMYDTVEAVLARHGAPYAVRNRQAGNRRWTRFDISCPEDLLRTVREFVDDGAKESDLVFGQFIRPGLLQAELMELPDGRWHLRYLRKSPRGMLSLRDGQGMNASGLSARDLVRRHVDPASMDDLDALLELYPGHVIELEAWDREVGAIPGRNTIIWEVRRY